MKFSSNPINILEDFFNIPLKKSTLKRFYDISDDKWIDFAKYYLQTMKDNFANQHFSLSRVENRNQIYFEPLLYHKYDSVLSKEYDSTPILGISPHPSKGESITSNEVSAMLNPLKKHLLVADSIYLRDNFHYCFDYVADSVDKLQWRNNPNIVSLVQLSINSIKKWLPILIELRKLIDTQSIVFMPYYITPTFPYTGYSPKVKEYWNKIYFRKSHDEIDESTFFDVDQDWNVPPVWDKTECSYFSKDSVKGAWLNSRLLKLNPVYPDQQMFEYASNLHFPEDVAHRNITCDLKSLSVLPFGNQREISIKDLISIRQNEEVFSEVKKTMIDLKELLERDCKSIPSQKIINLVCKDYIQQQLDKYEQRSIIKFINNPKLGVSISFAVGVMLLPVNPLISLFAGTAVSAMPIAIEKVLQSPNQKALGHLQMLL